MGPTDSQVQEITKGRNPDHKSKASRLVAPGLAWTSAVVWAGRHPQMCSHPGDKGLQVLVGSV